MLLDSNLHVYSNSWRNEEDESIIELRFLFDSVIFEDLAGESCLFLYASGNEAQKILGYSIFSPSSAKNALSIAASDKVYNFQNAKILISEEKMNLIYFTCIISHL